MGHSHLLLVIEGTYPWYRGGVSEWVARYLEGFSDYEVTLLQVATDRYRNASLEEALYDLPPHVTGFTRIPPPDTPLYHAG